MRWSFSRTLVCDLLEAGTMGRHTNRDLRKRRNMQKIAKKLRQARLKAKLPRTGSPASQN